MDTGLARDRGLPTRDTLIVMSEQDDTVTTGRQDRPGDPEGSRHRVDCEFEVPSGLDEPYEQEISHRVSLEFAHAEAVLEGLSERVLGVRERPQTLAQIAHRRHVEHRAQSPR